MPAIQLKKYHAYQETGASDGKPRGTKIKWKKEIDLELRQILRQRL